MIPKLHRKPDKPHRKLNNPHRIASNRYKTHQSSTDANQVKLKIGTQAACLRGLPLELLAVELKKHTRRQAACVPSEYKFKLIEFSPVLVKIKL